MIAGNKNRPVNLDLRTIRMPVGGIVSILHRISGVFLVLSIPACLYLLQQSLASAETYERVLDWLASGPGRLSLFVLSVVFVHHLLAGVRHLLLDLDIGISRRAARRSAGWVLAAVAATAAIGAGFLVL
jgi:succinate dehydrogenase / fumarate reductase cytochrome b subunit